MKTNRRAFTLIELLVVIAIMGVLLSMLLAGVQKAREAAARAQCASNLKQIGLALHTYHDAVGTFPPGSVSNSGNIDNYYGVWSVYILPYIEQDGLFGSYNFAKLNWDPVNAAVRTASIRVYSCPADRIHDQLLDPESGNGSGVPYRTGNYRAVIGRGKSANDYFDFNPNANSLPSSYRGPLHTTGFGGLNPERLDDISDGSSNTMLVTERSTKSHPTRHTFWAYAHASYWSASPVPQSRILLNDYDACVAVNPGDDGPCKRGISSFHANGFNVVFCDGSVHFISSRIDVNILCDMATIAGGEVASNY
jgi:prepilin-type N-terminal cleavage/methylation domain-containing protein/prepilin-type processing-associated H-X9-DG protein